MRILKGWPENERKELEEAKDNGFDSAMYLINRVVDYADDCTSLTKKYINGSSDENNQLARDIADYYAGVAKFPEQNLENKNMIAKIEVPNIFDEWYKGFPITAVRNKLAISEIAREGCGHSIILNTESRAYFEKSELNRLADFFNNNSKILIEMLNKYESKAYYVKPIQKYYIQLIKNNNSSYLNKCSPNGFYMPDTCRQDKLTQTQFTMDEIKDLGDKYVPFAIPVSEVNE